MQAVHCANLVEDISHNLKECFMFTFIRLRHIKQENIDGFFNLGIKECLFLNLRRSSYFVIN